jgi:endonuclease/exonuclease/phosphatase family metal-dependent hydrolase
MAVVYRKASAKRVAPPILAVLIVVTYIACQGKNRDPVPGSIPNGSVDVAPPATNGGYLFCFWNVENLFDDQDDKRLRVDEPYDQWFSWDAEARTSKLDRLSEILMRMNGGRGPDILCLAEVESVRAADLLRESMNRKLPQETAPYQNLQMKEVNSGRHIATALITRLPLNATRTRLHGSRLRILEICVVVNLHELTILSSHWTSQLQQRDGSHGDEGRERYADTLYEVFRKKHLNDARADLLVCGDFNDSPESVAVTNHLKAIGDRAKVAAGGSEPMLLNLMAGRTPDRFGTHYYDRPLIYDHVCVSPGLLDNEGWSCNIDTLGVVTEGLIRPGDSKRRPWRFGGEKDEFKGGSFKRGYSDHFPVTVRLSVATQQ